MFWKENMVEGSKFDDLARALGGKSTRRRVLAGIAGVVAGGLFTRQASARTLTICHATGNPAQPYESMTIDQALFNLHARHGDYLRVECCADGDCATLDGMCSSGTCQNGYCVQLPKPAGTPCGSDNACFEQGACDGAMGCSGADTPIACEPIDQCHTASCDSTLGCVQSVNTGGACIPDDTHDGTCHASGVCQPILVCTASPTCQSSSDCPSYHTCINGGCFASCASGCAGDCTNCSCTFNQGFAASFCLDGNTYIGNCESDANCPSGTLCSAFYNGGGYLCTQPCAHKQ